MATSQYLLLNIYYFLIALALYIGLCDSILLERGRYKQREASARIRRDIRGQPPRTEVEAGNLNGYKLLISGTAPGPSSRSTPTNKRSLLSYAHPRTNDICNTAECADASQFLSKTLNFNVDPCDDFFEFVCGRWIRENPIPPTASAWSFNGLIEQHVDRTYREILTSPLEVTDSQPLRQAKEFYYSCMDTVAIENEGLAPIFKILDNYGGWPVVSPNWRAVNFKLVETVGDINHVYMSLLPQSVLMDVDVEEDFLDTNRRIIYFDQTSFSLGRPFLVNADKYKSRLLAYKTYFINIVKAFASAKQIYLADAELNAHADDVIQFETKLAHASSAEENRTDYARLNNRKTLTEWQNDLNSFAQARETENAHAQLNLKLLLDTMFSSSGVLIDSEEILQIYEPDYFKRLIKILDETPLRTVANFVLWKLVEALVPETTEAMRSIKFEFNKVMYGVQKMGLREWTCPDRVVSQGFGMAMAGKFVEIEGFSDAEISEISGIVENIRKSFLQILNEETSEWLGNKTTLATVDKVEAIIKFLGYPNWIFNTSRLDKEYSGLQLMRGNYLLSAISLSHWFIDEHFKSLRLPNDKNAWHMHPGVINAFYYPKSNSIHVPAAYLSPPRFVMRGPESLNYGGLGSVLGHELTHSLDIEGSQFDLHGNINNWTSPFRIPAFFKKSHCFAEHYSQFRTPGGKINGKLTLSENLADNGGLRQAFHAYNALLAGSDGLLKGQRLPRMEGYTPEQLFFIGYGLNWCSSVRQQELENQLIESHSPPKYRVWGGVQNSMEFANSFKCPRGSPMNPFRKKCVLW